MNATQTYTYICMMCHTIIEAYGYASLRMRVTSHREVFHGLKQPLTFESHPDLFPDAAIDHKYQPTADDIKYLKEMKILWDDEKK